MDLPLDKIQPTIMNMEDNELEELYVRLDSCEKKLGLNCIEIDSINKQIGNTSQHITTDKKILKKCRTNLPLLKDRLIEVSKKNS